MTLVQHIKAGKVDVATIHDVDGFRQEHIEHERRAAKSEMWIKLGMLPRRSSSVCISTAALVVRKCHGKTQAQSDGRRVQGVDGIGQVQPQFFVDVQRPRLGDEPLGQRRMDTPVAPFVGIESNRLAEAHVIEFRCVDREAGLEGFPGRSAKAMDRYCSAQESVPGDRRHTATIRVKVVSDELSEQGLPVFMSGETCFQFKSTPCIFASNRNPGSQSQHRSVNRTAV